MDGSRFDRITRLLTEQRSRRTALGMAAAALLIGAEGASARKRRDKANDRAGGPPGKTTICHYDKDLQTYVKISVANSSLPAHYDQHGDYPYGDCCNSGECTRTSDTCSQGTCTCGSTGSACESGEYCQGGECVSPIVNGALTADDPTFDRTCAGGQSGLFQYDTQTWAHDGGPFSRYLASSGDPALSDPFLMVYSSFDPANPCANLVAQADDDFTCGSLNTRLEIADLPAGTYTLVITSWYYGMTGGYTLTDQLPVCAAAAGPMPSKRRLGS